MPFHAYPSGRTVYHGSAGPRGDSSSTGIFRVLALVAAIAGSSTAGSSPAVSSGPAARGSSFMASPLATTRPFVADPRIYR
jgi:hypothetical protein